MFSCSAFSERSHQFQIYTCPSQRWEGGSFEISPLDPVAAMNVIHMLQINLVKDLYQQIIHSNLLMEVHALFLKNERSKMSEFGAPVKRCVPGKLPAASSSCCTPSKYPAGIKQCDTRQRSCGCHRDQHSAHSSAFVKDPACTVGQDIAKLWLFACSYTHLCSLAGICTHKSGFKSVAGLRDAQGAFRTAEHPALLAAGLRKQHAPSFRIDLEFGNENHARFPIAAQDGGGNVDQTSLELRKRVLYNQDIALVGCSSETWPPAEKTRKIQTLL